MAIPKEIQREHVLGALEILAKNPNHDFGPSTTYDLIYEGKRYAPKAVIGFAAELATGERLKPHEFQSGIASGKAIDLLRRLDFVVVRKAARSSATLLNAWLLLAFGDNRQYAGNAGYHDDTEGVYRFDSFVPNYKRVVASDVAFVANQEGLQSIARIESIESREGFRLRQRCPTCETTAIKRRKNRKPTFRCDHGHVFDDPLTQQVQATHFDAIFSQPVIRVSGAIPLETLRRACPEYNGQLAMQRLDATRIINELKANAPAALALLGESSRNDEGTALPTQEEERRLFLNDSKKRKAVELRAMELAIRHYDLECRYNVRDTSKTHSFDLECRKGNEIRRVEVKGTTTSGEFVNVTDGEVRNAFNEDVPTDLFVVSRIRLVNRTTATGGIISAHIKNWRPRTSDLTPTQYWYRVDDGKDV